MPYFVYYVTESTGNKRKSLEHVETFDTFKAARKVARERRADLKSSGEAAGGRDCRLIFAKNQVEAEKLLSAPREERVVGED
ncbi:MAG: hypothetical protein KDI82_04490 [Gammaproteobacteria bacterium]|nr:hypothetical protein [Gammaproteobacteria bacterium]